MEMAKDLYKQLFANKNRRVVNEEVEEPSEPLTRTPVAVCVGVRDIYIHIYFGRNICILKFEHGDT